MKRFLVLFAAALIGAAAPAIADAQPRGRSGEQQFEEPNRGERGNRGNRGDRDDGQRQEREIPLPTLIRMVERSTGGEYVNANPRMVGGRKFYWMRLKFPGGRFQDYMVDAATGQF